MTTKVTITEALAEIKTVGKRVEKKKRKSAEAAIRLGRQMK